MRKWNKLLAMVLAMVMVFGLTATAFAEEGDAADDGVMPISETDEKTPVDGESDEDAAPADDEDAAPADDEEAAPADDEDAAPADDEDAAPADDEDAAPADDEDAAPAAANFSDVTASNWHYEFVMKMAAAGVVNGYADGSFKPNDSVKWGEALKMVVSYVTGEEKAAVEGGTWASGYIAYVQENGIWEDEIDQNAVITREEMCVVLAKTLKVAASEKDSIFPDTDNAYVMALVELGIIDGINGSFQPDGALTRAQLCKILATIPEDLEPAEGEGDDAAEPAEGEGDDAAEPAEGEGDDATEPTEAEGDNATEPAEGEAEGDDAPAADDADAE